MFIRKAKTEHCLEHAEFSKLNTQKKMHCTLSLPTMSRHDAFTLQSSNFTVQQTPTEINKKWYTSADKKQGRAHLKCMIILNAQSSPTVSTDLYLNNETRLQHVIQLQYGAQISNQNAPKTAVKKLKSEEVWKYLFGEGGQNNTKNSLGKRA